MKIKKEIYQSIHYIFHEYENYEGCICDRLMAVVNITDIELLKDIPTLLKRCGYVIEEKRDRTAMTDRFYVLSEDEFNRDYVYTFE